MLHPFLPGHPSPKVTWWRDHALLDSLSEEVTEGRVTNELRLTQLKRDDLHTILTCQGFTLLSQPPTFGSKK